MKHALSIPLLVAAAVACQSQQNQAASAGNAASDKPHNAQFGIKLPDSSAKGIGHLGPETAKVVPDSMPPIPVRFGEVLRKNIRSQPVLDTAEIRWFFVRHKLAPLIQTITSGQGGYAMNGFRGPEQYRTEVVITAARQNPRHPLTYALHGMTRTKRRIQHFRGEVVFNSLFVEPMLTAQDKKDIDNWTMVRLVRLDNDSTIKRYAVAGSVRLAETNTSSQAGTFRGRLVMELELTSKGWLHLDAPFLHGPSQGGDQKYAGQWTTYQTRQTSPSVWVKSITGYGPFIYSDFVIGERDVDINPKYARLGWNTIWENDEWWAKSPKAKLSL